MKRFFILLLTVVLLIASYTVVVYATAHITKNRIIKEQKLSVEPGYITCELDGELYLYWR